MSPVLFSVSAGGIPEEALQGTAGELQPSGEARGERLGPHPGGAGPHPAADHRRGEDGRVLPTSMECFISEFSHFS